MKAAKAALAAGFALIAGASTSACIGYGKFISPAEAQRIEISQCEAKPDPEDRRKCLGYVARKYHRYNSEGGYPQEPRIPNPRD